MNKVICKQVAWSEKAKNITLSVLKGDVIKISGVCARNLECCNFTLY